MELDDADFAELRELLAERDRLAAQVDGLEKMPGYLEYWRACARAWVRVLENYGGHELPDVIADIRRMVEHPPMTKALAALEKEGT